MKPEIPVCDIDEIEKRDKEFEALQEENNNLRMKLAVLIAEIKPKEQTKILGLLGKIISNEIEQEQLCEQ